jgi:hypothetical protein
MHEYPFNISKHEYFVEFIKSLRPRFFIKSHVTIRKEILNMFLQEKEKFVGVLDRQPTKRSTRGR